jgi:hypothetical protein
MRVPKIAVRFVHLRIFLLLLDRGETFLLLVPHPSGLGRLATNQNRPANNKANKLKMLRI